MERAFPVDEPDGQQRVTAQGFFEEAVRSWPLLIALVAVAVIAAVGIVRLSTPMYVASMTMTRAGESKLGALSILSQAAGGSSADDSSVDELRATLTSRNLAGRLLREQPIAAEIGRWLTPKEPTAIEVVRRRVSETLFGQKREYRPDLRERLRIFLDSNLTLEYDKGVFEGRLKSYDRTFSEHLLQAAITDARDIVRQRQQARAVASREFLTRMLAERTTQLSTMVANDQLSRAVGETILALSPSSDKFVVIDDVFAEDRPVSPKVGLISAVCLAIGLIIFCGVIAIRGLMAPRRV